MRVKRLVVGAAAVASAALMLTPGIGTAVPAGPGSSNAAIPRYQHIVEIMMENQNFGTIYGNPLAPRINALANEFGIASDYFGVTHPSEPNYVANIGGDYFGIQDDNQFYCTPALATTDPNCGGTTVDHTVNAPNLATQLTDAGFTWKGYFQSLPPVPSSGLITTGHNANGPYTFKWPSNSVALYASKHNPFLNFTGTQGALANMVPDTELATDLANNQLPNYSLIVPNQCNDMHGTSGCEDLNGLVAAGDAYVGNTVDLIMDSKDWQTGRNAIVITWDEDDFGDSGQPGTGCCGFDPGGGHVLTIVITNKNGYPLVDNTPYNHFSLLASIEDAFRLPLLLNAGDAAVQPMTPLFHP